MQFELIFENNVPWIKLTVQVLLLNIWIELLQKDNG